eukprot:CAMPEP_0201283878 /NCGR_PEP_ID=MMETSP1317-20130820/52454_1 /ASSEMBLY_ACC=CAM_ASM_000770 /TAXON_ID=187299 /ORGANISM="Undescribed Undescribed, Strain Undescribed" /LENGTH=31 /DNA_ID= /DNA_START= /DNA_END= /DNA_ORIENTATION=
MAGGSILGLIRGSMKDIGKMENNQEKVITQL